MMPESKINIQTLIVAVIVSVVISVAISYSVISRETGPPGPEGLQGPQGIQGILGETGPRGPQGFYYAAYRPNLEYTEIDGIVNGGFDGNEGWVTWGMSSGIDGAKRLYQYTSGTRMTQQIMISENQGVAFDLMSNGARLEVHLDDKVIFYADLSDGLDWTRVVIPFPELYLGPRDLYFRVLAADSEGIYIGIDNVTIVAFDEGVAGDEVSPVSGPYSGNDYMWFEPGHYLHYTETYNEIDNRDTKDLEVVYQETVNDGIFITLNFLDREHHGSSLLGGSDGDKLRLSAGFPSRNEHNLWFLVTLPKSFNDGDMWKYNYVSSRVSYVGNWIVNGEKFTDVIKITIDSLNYPSEYNQGEGEVYLAKNVGIIDWEFRKTNGEVFNIEIEDWGELPPRVISGRLTLDGTHAATGYHVGLSNMHENDATSKITDEMGEFSFIAYGHKLTLRYASILSDGKLDWTTLGEHELFDVDSDITDVIISLED